MRVATYLRFLTILVIFFSTSILDGCGGPTILSQTYKRRVEPPAKRVPSQAIVPATQRPYKIKGKSYFPLPTSEGYSEKGIASWYGNPFHGRKTSNGETYDMHALTAAHKTLPMETLLLVRNIENKKEIVVRINDRGPFVRGRIIDLSLTGAKRLGMDAQGTAMVKLSVLGETISYRQGRTTVQRFLPHQDFETGDFFVQIGSFSRPANAERLLRKVTNWGSEAVIQPYNHPKGRFYRVQVRAGTSLREAKRMERVFVEAGFTGSFVVAR